MDADELLSRVLDAKLLTEREMRKVCMKVKEILVEESNVQPVNAPVTICGDIHGQFFDLKELLRIGGHPPDTNYIFIGDFVDRGHNSVETIELLFCLKLKYPSHITLLRGNHESRQITSIYGFYDEINAKYGNANVWNYCMDTFDYLPLGACIEGEVFCIHGGLSPEIKTIDQIRLIDRKQEVPNKGPFSDLMWSDPGDVDTWVMSQRGAGWIFGARVVNEFNHLNGINLIARAHQLAEKGYHYWYPDKNLVTVWSAPNYCYRCGNVAAILQINENMERNFEIFKEVPESAEEPDSKTVLPYFL